MICEWKKMKKKMRKKNTLEEEEENENGDVSVSGRKLTRT